MPKSHKRIKFLACILTILSFLAPFQAGRAQSQPASPTQQKIIHVPGDLPSLQAAISAYSDGDIIELAGGVYTAPSGGWSLGPDFGKGFTLRAAPGAQVMLSGSGLTPIIRLQNTARSLGKPFVFKNIIFDAGVSTTEGLAGGITLMEAEAEFIDCVFQNNHAEVSNSVGGALLIANHSIAFFSNSVWKNNTSRVAGGGLSLASQAAVYLVNGQFINNSTNVPNRITGAVGGGVYSANSVLRIANTRFEGNQAGAFGGALYAIGTWSGPLSVPQNDLLVVNSTFVNNLVNTTAPLPYPAEGGAISVEGQSLTRIYNSRFEKNTANIGGGVTSYRSNVEIYNSIFRGNVAVGANFTSTFGGAIASNSLDTVLDGTDNRPPARLVVEDSYFQGRFDGIGITGQNGGCLQAGGDGNRIDGLSGVAPMGTLAENRTTVILRRNIFNDCEVNGLNGFSGVGGAITVNITNLTMDNNLVLLSRAYGTNAAGGGVAILNRSIAQVTNSTFASNAATDPNYTSLNQYGGGMFVQASTINLSSSRFIDNQVSVGVAEPVYQSFGAAFFAGPDEALGLGPSGTISDTLFSHDSGISIFDDDRANGPNNAMRYNGNTFAEPSFAGPIYHDNLSSPWTVDQLNTGMIRRSNGSQTVKSTVNNISLSSASALGIFQAAPAKYLPTAAAGDPPQSAPVFYGYAWDGSSAQMNGAALAEHSGVVVASTPASPILTVGGSQFKLTVPTAQIASGRFAAEPPVGSSYQANWTTHGSFLDAAIDRSVTIAPVPNGSIAILNDVNEGDYRLYLFTQEGGVVLPLLNVPALQTETNSMALMVGKNRGPSQAYFDVTNQGGGALNWTVSGGVPGLTSLLTTSGQTLSSARIYFSINPQNFLSGRYSATFVVDGGLAGVSLVTFTIDVVNNLQRLFVPQLRH